MLSRIRVTAGQGARPVRMATAEEVQADETTRRIAADDLYLGPYSTAIESDELLTAIEFPDWPSDSIALFREIAPRPGAELEHHRGEPHPLDRRPHRTPLVGELAQSRTHEHPDVLIGRADHR